MSGIAIAGTLVVDHLKIIDHYPPKGMLADISSTTRGIGGCAANTACAVKTLDPSIPVSSIALVGEDENGAFVRETLKKHGINTDGIAVTSKAPTSYSDVMTIAHTGERTFFHDRGACRLFSAEQIDFERIDADLIMVGYGALLDSLDQPDEVYGTGMARLFHDIQSHGIRTAMDVASMKDPEMLRRLVLPSLAYTDYLIVNETEGGMLAGLEARGEDGTLISGRMEQIVRKLKASGNCRIVVVHAPEMGCGMDEAGNYFEEPSLNLPEGYIVGAVGAGDAFCGGILYAVYRGLSLQDALKVAAASAAANLSAADSVSGLCSAQQAWELHRRYGTKQSE